MRVISGTARRILLVAPDGLSTRPTSDRAKEGLFNILGTRVKDAYVLDIFCGSGALGIEALSRGAKAALFVDNAPSAIRAVKENLGKTKLGNAEVLNMAAEDVIMRLAAERRQFDIIFSDPPYDAVVLNETLVLLSEAKILSEKGIVIAESDANTQLDGFSPTDTRLYGRTKFFFFEAGAV
ncbi:MAG: 16S rRNA (guanine(966)-N(2))-methyltransferase RsmD [Defluviitaleaceae bacterium]|nr:16S rRNA (guanine(966)-N(2))-methyltransferase RsmD [Defluviitaleaceae bacterium]